MTISPTFSDMRDRAERIHRSRLLDQAVRTSQPRKILRTLEAYLSLKPDHIPAWAAGRLSEIRQQYHALKRKRAIRQTKGDGL